MIWLHFYLKMILLTIMLGLWPVLAIHYRRRGERRASSGWKLIRRTNSILRNLDELWSLVIFMGLGAYLSETFHVQSFTLILLGLILNLLITPFREKWIPPGDGGDGADRHLNSPTAEGTR